AFSSSRSPRAPSIGLMPARSASSAAAWGLSHWSLGHGCRAYRRLEAAPLLVFAAKNKRVSLTRRNLKSGRLLSVCKNLRQHARLRAENSREGGHIMSETAIIERDVVVPAVSEAGRTPFSWSAAIAGAFVATAVTFIIVALGSG